MTPGQIFEVRTDWPRSISGTVAHFIFICVDARDKSITPYDGAYRGICRESVTVSRVCKSSPSSRVDQSLLHKGIAFLEALALDRGLVAHPNGNLADWEVRATVSSATRSLDAVLTALLS